ncbi:TetR/AcrR family transcriptional regulator [Microbacterium pygmaeum]|uniref:Regulatory protein, tetR family n=1 Tax=Microbacterium pygmaeum TaxID=370764 RepID=A0A1G7U6V8_9MICO|nr:TetR/AcrR family transcriptional regulator [Microbacterium pygmaeum]SDG43352.1 regulatory protein, tetR family [Microbacterium pygmaeum]
MTLRADAARSRERILAAARSHDVRALRLNDVARDAGVGIGTVYRHFPTVHALIEALSIDSLGRLQDASEAAARNPDPLSALHGFLRAALLLQLEDAGLEAVLIDLARTDPVVHSECAAARAEVFAGYTAVLTRAQRAGVVREDVSPAQLQRLVCGVEHAVRLGAPDDRSILLDILLAGIGPRTQQIPAVAAC